MQNVSDAYKGSISLPLRNRGYMRVEFGIPNAASQTNAVIDGDMYWLSDPSKIFKHGTDNFVYASLEENFIKADGSKYIAPNNAQGYLYETSLISNGFPSDEDYVFSVIFGQPVSLSIISFNFGMNYPVDFDITDDDDNTFEVRNNDQSILTIENTFTDITELTFRIINMVYPDDRFRLYSMTFGLGLLYENDSIIESDQGYTLSPINETLPTMDFSVTLVNEDHFFDVDNPKSVLNLFDTSTKVTVSYGYQVDENTIEWIPGGELYCYTWSTDDKTAMISARDILQNFDTEYIFGSVANTSLYDLAVKVFQTMGISNYVIDPELDLIYTQNPMPRVSCKEALQIISNMANKKLLLTRSGGIKIGDVVTTTLTSNKDYYGKLNSVRDLTEKIVYASMENNLIKADGQMYIAPNSFTNCYDTGFVSSNMSEDDGFFVRVNDNILLVDDALNHHIGVLEYILQTESYDSNNIPKITISIAEVAAIGSIAINFGETICDVVRVGCFIDDTLVQSITVTDNSAELLEIAFEKNMMNKIEIQFIKTLIPERRVYVDWIKVNSGTSFTISQNDMLSYPQFTKFPKIKEINVPWYAYQMGLDERKLLNRDITVEDTATVYRFLMREPCSDYRVSVSSGMASIVDYGNYYVDVTFSDMGENTLILYGKKYTVVEQVYTKAINEEGEVINWKNPLVDSEEKAIGLSNWLADYYTCPGTYNYQTRGNPELDVNDIIFQDHYLGDRLKMLVTESNLKFNGAFSGNVKLLRLGGE